MTGEQIYKLGLTRIGCKYQLGVVAPKNDANYMGAFDCAEFTSWLVFQVGGILYGCNTTDVKKAKTADAYTGFWANDAKNRGQIISVEQGIKTKGAALLRIAADGKIGHIVISDGLGGTVEAHSTKYGVIKSKTTDRRFDMGILVPGFTYQESTVPVVNEKPKGIVYRYIKGKEIVSDVVGRIQQALVDRGYLEQKYVTKLYGPLTMNAVYEFQKAEGLTPDGEVYTNTAAALGISL